MNIKRARERRVRTFRALGSDIGLHRAGGIDDRQRGDELFSQERGELIAYNTAIRDAIPRIHARKREMYICRVIPKAISIMLKYIHAAYAQTYGLFIQLSFIGV